MAAMENAANVDDFSEYKHKDNLIEQVIKYFTQNFTVLDRPPTLFREVTLSARPSIHKRFRD